MLERLYEHESYFECDCHDQCSEYFFIERVENISERNESDLLRVIYEKISDYWCGEVYLHCCDGVIDYYQYWTECEEELIYIEHIRNEINSAISCYK